MSDEAIVFAKKDAFLPQTLEVLFVLVVGSWLLLGADRVEGCLFGNGERTGNVSGHLAKQPREIGMMQMLQRRRIQIFSDQKSHLECIEVQNDMIHGCILHSTVQLIPLARCLVTLALNLFTQGIDPEVWSSRVGLVNWSR